MTNQPERLLPHEQYNKKLYKMLCWLLAKMTKEKETSRSMFYLAAGQITQAGVWLSKKEIVKSKNKRQGGIRK